MIREEARAKMAVELMRALIEMTETIAEFRAKGGTAQDLIDALKPQLGRADEAVLEYVIGQGMAQRALDFIAAEQATRGQG